MSLNCGHQRAFRSSPRWYMSMDRHGGIILTGKNRITRRKLCPIVTLSTTNPKWIDPNRTWASAVRDRRLTAWAMVRPCQKTTDLHLQVWSDGNSGYMFLELAVVPSSGDLLPSYWQKGYERSNTSQTMAAAGAVRGTGESANTVPPLGAQMPQQRSLLLHDQTSVTNTQNKRSHNIQSDGVFLSNVTLLRSKKRRRMLEVETMLHAFLTSATDGVKGQFNAPV
jgi:hypothetical protein